VAQDDQIAELQQDISTQAVAPELKPVDVTADVSEVTD